MGIDSIEKSDLIIIDNIAKKYKLTLQELGKIISKKYRKTFKITGFIKFRRIILFR